MAEAGQSPWSCFIGIEQFLGAPHDVALVGARVVATMCPRCSITSKIGCKFATMCGLSKAKEVVDMAVNFSHMHGSGSFPAAAGQIRVQCGEAHSASRTWRALRTKAPPAQAGTSCFPKTAPTCTAEHSKEERAESEAMRKCLQLQKQRNESRLLLSQRID